MLCKVTYSRKDGSRGSMEVIAESSIAALLIVMQTLQLDNAIVKVLAKHYPGT